MDEVFKESLQPALCLLAEYARESFALADDFFLLLKAPADKSKAGLLRDRYYSAEQLKSQLEQQVVVLRGKIMVPDFEDELGKLRLRHDRNREAWVNWIEFISRSVMLSLQGLYARFLFEHQSLLFEPAENHLLVNPTEITAPSSILAPDCDNKILTLSE